MWLNLKFKIEIKILIIKWYLELYRNLYNDLVYMKQSLENIQKIDFIRRKNKEFDYNKNEWIKMNE